MARNYAALPFDYIEEMSLLSNEEFGRLCRALLVFAKTGKGDELIEGNERFLWNRVKAQETRFQDSYDELTTRRKNAGKRGAEKRWGKNSKPSEPVDPKGADGNSNHDTATEGNADDGKHGYHETEFNLSPSVPEDTDEAQAFSGGNPEFREVIRFYQDNLCFDMPRESISLIEFWLKKMGKDAVILGLKASMSGVGSTWSGSRSWRYVKGVFENWISAGVHDIESANQYVANHNIRSGAASGTNCSDNRQSSQNEQYRRFRGNVV